MEALQDFCLHQTPLNFCRLSKDERFLLVELAKECLENSFGKLEVARKIIEIDKMVEACYELEIQSITHGWYENNDGRILRDKSLKVEGLFKSVAWCTATFEWLKSGVANPKSECMGADKKAFFMQIKYEGIAPTLYNAVIAKEDIPSCVIMVDKKILDDPSYIYCIQDNYNYFCRDLQRIDNDVFRKHPYLINPVKNEVLFYTPISMHKYLRKIYVFNEYTVKLIKDFIKKLPGDYYKNVEIVLLPLKKKGWQADIKGGVFVNMGGPSTPIKSNYDGHHEGKLVYDCEIQDFRPITKEEQEKIDVESDDDY